MPVTAYIHDPLFLTHNTGSRHPERSERLVAAQALLETRDWYGQLRQLETAQASLEDVARVHDPAYIERVAESAPDWPSIQWELGCDFASLGEVERGLEHLRNYVRRGGATYQFRHCRLPEGRGDVQTFEREYEAAKERLRRMY